MKTKIQRDSARGRKAREVKAQMDAKRAEAKAAANVPRGQEAKHGA
ncbi:MAG: hypothetical protein PHO89_09585 [Methylacidiphilaceae bacterium]|nr:hypothetical protein [Candidatus Methylacidiphilaceae bacterium]